MQELYGVLEKSKFNKHSFFYLPDIVPDVEVKGERAHYFLLVQGWEDAGRVTCRVRFLNSVSQINGAAAMATISGLLRRTSSSGRYII